MRCDWTCLLCDGTCMLCDGTCMWREGTCVWYDGICTWCDGTCMWCVTWRGTFCLALSMLVGVPSEAVGFGSLPVSTSPHFTHAAWVTLPCLFAGCPRFSDCARHHGENRCSGPSDGGVKVVVVVRSLCWTEAMFVLMFLILASRSESV